MNATFQVSPVSIELLIPALKLVFARFPSDELKLRLARTIAEYQANPKLFDGLFIATQSNQVVGALWGVAVPGKTLLTGLPVVAPGIERQPIIAALFKQLNGWADQTGQSLNQIVVDSSEDREWESLLFQNEFTLKLPLDYFSRSLDAKEPNQRKIASVEREQSPQPVARTRLVPFASADTCRFQTILESTFLDSMDCPQLDGVQQFDEMLSGYAATGNTGTQFWYRVEQEGEDAGIVLLSKHIKREMMELVYIGISPTYRRKGVAQAAINNATQIAQTANCNELIAAVSVQNVAAYRMYQTLGFEKVDSRISFLRTNEMQRHKPRR